jgi:hypothetical protein
LCNVYYTNKWFIEILCSCSEGCLEFLLIDINDWVFQTIIVPTEPKIGGGLIRQIRKSKNKGPKRLGKHSLSKEKKNNDEIEGKIRKDLQQNF